MAAERRHQKRVDAEDSKNRWSSRKAVARISRPRRGAIWKTWESISSPRLCRQGSRTCRPSRWRSDHPTRLDAGEVEAAEMSNATRLVDWFLSETVRLAAASITD